MMMGCSWLYIHEHRMTLLGLLICRKLILTLSIRNMTVLKLEDIRIMEDIRGGGAGGAAPGGGGLLEERLKLIIIFGKRQGMKSV